MTPSPQKFREVVLQILYSQMSGNHNSPDTTSLLIEELALTVDSLAKAWIRVNDIQKALPKIDPLIAEFSTTYDFERIQVVTKEILRLSLFELLYDPDIPKEVAIAEAIRLARKFGSPESSSFVHAVLDAILRSQNRSKEPGQDVASS